MEWTFAALGLGSNVGDTTVNLCTAISMLGEHDQIEIIAQSSDYQTPPWGPVPQDDFLNCCVKIRTGLSAQELLSVCLEIEQRIGRVRDVRWGPRVIDIDVLLFGNEIISRADLEVPHPRMSERAFVLVPLAEIWPDAKVSEETTVLGALAHCPDVEGVTRVGTPSLLRA